MNKKSIQRKKRDYFGVWVSPFKKAILQFSGFKYVIHDSKMAICYVAYGNKCITIFRDPVEMVESIKYENQVMFDTQ